MIKDLVAVLRVLLPWGRRRYKMSRTFQSQNGWNEASVPSIGELHFTVVGIRSSGTGIDVGGITEIVVHLLG